MRSKMYINHIISDKMQFWIKENVFTEDLVQSISKSPGQNQTHDQRLVHNPYIIKKNEIKPQTCGIVSLKL